MADTLKARITDAMKEAMRSKVKDRLATIRLMQAAIKQVEIDTRQDLSDTDLLAILDKMLKQRRDSITQYREGGREELAAREEAEIAIIQEFMPAALDEEEIDALIEEALSATHAESVREMGKVMGYIKPRAQGRVDMGALSIRIRTRLAG